MNLSIITQPLNINLHGFSGTALNKDYSGTAFKLMDKMWQEVRSKGLKNKLILLIFTCFVSGLSAQNPTELHQKIAELDSIFFAALNNCDTVTYKSLLAEDFEAYHDKAGLTKSREREMADISVFCAEQRKRQALRRELKGPLEVYPLNNYGAIENCKHVFYLQINDTKEKLVAQAKFTGVWKFENNEWKLARSLSYDHQPLAEIELADEILSSYEGNYRAADRTVKLKKEGKILRMTDLVDGKEVWNTELLPESENLFYLNFENIQVEFRRNGTRVEKFVVYENGVPKEELIKIK